MSSVATKPVDPATISFMAGEAISNDRAVGEGGGYVALRWPSRAVIWVLCYSYSTLYVGADDLDD
jgi:hypothetical protein